MRIPTGFNVEAKKLGFGVNFNFLNPEIDEFTFVMVALHNCIGCMTFNVTLLGVHFYIGWRY